MNPSYFLILFVPFYLPCAAFSVDWETEEEAQLVAEQVVNQPFNSNKKNTLIKRTARLQPSMATLVKKVTNLDGENALLAGNQVNIGDGQAQLAESLGRLNAKVTEDEVRIRLEAAVLFAFDKDDLRPDALEKLYDVLTVIAGYPDFPVSIEGHTCSMGSKDYNKKLSIRRATSVQSWLLNSGINKKRLSVFGHGELQPVAENETEAGRMQNRRVELVMRKN